MQEHTSRCHPSGAPFGCSLRDVLVVFAYGEAAHQCLDAWLAVANPRGRATLWLGLRAVSDSPWPTRRPAGCRGACLGDDGMILWAKRHLPRPHLIAPARMSGGLSCRGAFVRTGRVAGAAHSTLSASSRNVPPLRQPRSILKLSHAGASTIPARPAPRSRNPGACAGSFVAPRKGKGPGFKMKEGNAAPVVRATPTSWLDAEAA